MTKGYYLWELNLEVNKEVPSKYLLSFTNGALQVTEKHESLANALLRDFPNAAGNTLETPDSEPLVDKDLPLIPNFCRSLEIPVIPVTLLNNLEQLC